MKVSIVIPNHNGEALIRKNLPCVIEASNGSEVIVVDDGSTDGSLDLLKRKFGQVRIIAKPHQEGFASAVNRGVAGARGDVVVLLNTDVRPEKEFLPALIKHFSDPRVFAVGCLEKSIEEGGIVLRGRGEAVWKKGFYIHRRGEVTLPTTAWVSGGSGAFRKSIWEKLGGMDRMYNPFYWEDIDLSYRALKAGYALRFEPKSVVVHEHAKGTIQERYTRAFVARVAYRNQFLFIWKNVSDLGIFLDHAIWTPIRLIQAVLARDGAMIVGYLWALCHLPHALGSRMRSSRHWILKDREIQLS